MTTTLAAIHRDPAILDRAIAGRERLDIVAGGEVIATLLPAATAGIEEARRVMRERFAAPDWEFAVGQPSMGREEAPRRFMRLAGSVRGAMDLSARSGFSRATPVQESRG